MLDLPLGAACLLVALFHAAGLVTRRAPAGPAAAQVLMGWGMAAMVLPALDPLPPAVWVAAFAATGAVAGVAALRERATTGGAGHQVVGSAAMLLMLLTGHDHRAPDGAAGLLVTLLALVLAGWYAADVARTLLGRDPAVDGAAPQPAGGAVAVRVRTGTTAARVAHLVTAAAMIAMLLGSV